MVDKLEAIADAKERALIDSNNYYMARTLAVKRLRDEGYSLREIGFALGISHEWARRLLQEQPET